MIAPILTAVGGVVSSIANANANRKAYERQWNDQKGYNNPTAQNARMLTAGINPNIAYGNGNVVNTQTPPKYEPNKIDLGDTANKTTQSYIAELQADNLQANNDLIKANIRNIDSQTYSRDNYQNPAQYAKMNLDSWVADLKTKESQWFDVNQKNRQFFEETRNAIQSIDQQFATQYKQLGLQKGTAEYNNILATTKKTYQEISELAVRMRNMNTQNAKMESEKVFQDLSNLWKANGISGSDSALSRVLMTIDKNVFSPEMLQAIDQYTKDYLGVKKPLIQKK